MKHCRCGRSYTLSDWNTLRLVGYMEDGGKHTKLELRDCHCGSTLAQRILRLAIELVPAQQWGDNLRTRLPRAQWDALRRACYAAAGHRCEVCGMRGSRHPVECHERWEYDERKRVQKLVGLIALCPRCHEVKHFGRAVATGNEMRALEHFARVNDLTPAAACDEVEAAFDLHEYRTSLGAWQLDLSWLEQGGKHERRRRLL